MDKFKLIAFILTFLFSNYISARVTLEAAVVAQDDTGASFSAMDEGDGTSSINPINVFIPFANGAGNEQESYIYPAGTQLIEIQQGGGAGTDVGEAFEKHPMVKLIVKHDQLAHDYIQVLVKNGDSYSTTVIGTAGSNEYIAANQNGAVILYLTLDNINDAGGSPFSDYYAASNTDEMKIDQKIYIFSTDTLISGTGKNPEDHAGGIYLTLKFSSDYPTETINLRELKRGDSQLTAVYEASGSISELYRSLSFNYTVGQAASQTLQTASVQGSVIDIYSGALNSGNLIISGLTNSVSYNISVGLMDKYQFVTKLSPSVVGTPLQIETFLEKKTCYFFSAGFQDDHYVLEFLRSFRDKHLLTNKWGRAFVSYYYATAPQYAHYIYNSKILSAIVRGVGYSLYFILQKVPGTFGTKVPGTSYNPV